MLELDLLLNPFVRDIYPQLAAPAQHSYQLLLQKEDTDLYQWLALGQVPPQALTDIVSHIRQHAQKYPFAT